MVKWVLVLHHKSCVGHFLSFVGVGCGIVSPDALRVLAHIVPLWAGLRGRQQLTETSFLPLWCFLEKLKITVINILHLHDTRHRDCSIRIAYKSLTDHWNNVLSCSSHIWSILLVFAYTLHILSTYRTEVKKLMDFFYFERTCSLYI